MTCFRQKIHAPKLLLHVTCTVRDLQMLADLTYSCERIPLDDLAVYEYTEVGIFVGFRYAS